MTRVLIASCIFSVAAFVLTYVLAEDTEQYFAWTVQPPLSAAFFGAGYGTGALLAGLSLRERSWARIRPGVLAIIIFATLTLVVTLLHRDRFHFGEGGFAEGSAWIWLAIYVVFPIAGIIALVTQWRALGSDPPQAGPLPSALRGILAIQAVVLGLLGLGLLLFPESVATFWPWTLTPLTATGDRRMAAPHRVGRRVGGVRERPGEVADPLHHLCLLRHPPDRRAGAVPGGGRLEPLVGLGASRDGGADPGHRDRGEGGGGAAPSR